MITAALITGLLCNLPGSGPGKDGIRLIGSLVLIITILRPAASLDLSSLLTEAFAFQTGIAQTYADAGTKIKIDAVNEIIEQKTKAYILDKAAQLDVELSAEITVTDGIPVAARLSGSVSPNVRQRLSAFLDEELGIPKERQAWK